MLSQQNVLAFIFIQGSSLLLLWRAQIPILKALRFWSLQNHSQGQIKLEKEIYLIDLIIKFCLLAQIINLVWFFNLVNSQLTTQIKGAMCAEGVLSSMENGHLLLYFKAISIVFYMIYFILQILDSRESLLPLTPSRYFFFFPIIILSTVDFYGSISFFSGLKPDIITTCCGVNTITSGYDSNDLSNANYLNYMLWFWIANGSFLLGLHIFGTRQSFFFNYTQLFSTIFHLTLSIYLLKYYFVKYMYGLPTHDCLYDVFLWKYGGLGYFIFGLYYTMLFISLLLLIGKSVLKYLSDSQSIDYKFLFWIQIACLITSFALPLYFSLNWKGAL